MNVTEVFPQLADEWRSHCQQVAFSSNLNDRLDHPAYRQLAKLGPEAVPLAIECLQSDDLAPWEFVLQEIANSNFVGDPDDYSPAEARQKCLYWWVVQQTRAAG